MALWVWLRRRFPWICKGANSFQNTCKYLSWIVMIMVDGNEEGGSFVLQIKQTLFFPWSFIFPFNMWVGYLSNSFPIPSLLVFTARKGSGRNGKLSFTVPSTNTTSECGCWIDWWNSCPWFRGWHSYRGSWDSQISRTRLLLHLHAIFAEWKRWPTVSNGAIFVLSYHISL